jgi:group I intron endonuclease
MLKYKIEIFKEVNINYIKMEYTIYKIYCKDENIKDCYVGSTKDLSNRKAVHKFDCKNKDINVYKFIKENGGFDNFEFEVVETLICENKNDAYIRERYWIEELKANLNIAIPTRTKKEYKQHWINSFDYSNHRKNADKNYKERNKYKLRQGRQSVPHRRRRDRRADGLRNS